MLNMDTFRYTFFQISGQVGNSRTTSASFCTYEQSEVQLGRFNLTFPAMMSVPPRAQNHNKSIGSVYINS